MMVNATMIFSNTTLLQSVEIQEIMENAHLLILIGIALCILLWYAAKLEGEQLLKDAAWYRRQRERKQRLKQLNKGYVAAALHKGDLLMPHHASGRLNPGQSVERQQRKHSESAASKLATISPTKRRLYQHTRSLNSEQSEELRRLRMKRLDFVAKNKKKVVQTTSQGTQTDEYE